MFRTLSIAALCVVLSPIAAQAATSQASSKFSISLTYEQAVKWYAANHSGVLNASNCRILKDQGQGDYLVQTNTPAGACQYIIRETREQGQTKDGRPRSTYRVKYVRNVSGRVANQEVTITMTDTGAKTEISMWMTTSVAGRFVPVSAVRNVQSGCLSGCESYMTRNAR
jgi:hypothetical protein